MFIVFATLVVDSKDRAQIAEKMNARLQDIAPRTHGAINFELLLSASDPGNIHVFQTWESPEAFEEWGSNELHTGFQAEFRPVMKGASSLKFVGTPAAG